jgi:phosphohistidine phosphatase
MPSKPAPKSGETPAKPLRLILIRHGKAQRHSDSGRDEDRRLKPRGERQAKWLGKQLSQDEMRPVVLLHSPVHRAVQTAARLADQLECETKEADALSLGGPARAVVDLVKRRRDAGVLALVGHNPQLEEVAQLMVPHFRRIGDVNLRTGEALVIELGNDLTGGKLLTRLRLEEEDDDDD